MKPAIAHLKWPVSLSRDFVGSRVQRFRVQPSLWPPKFTCLRSAASLIKEKTSLEPETRGLMTDLSISDFGFSILDLKNYET
jgi:hypothetical protein